MNQFLYLILKLRLNVDKALSGNNFILLIPVTSATTRLRKLRFCPFQTTFTGISHVLHI